MQDMCLPEPAVGPTAMVFSSLPLAVCLPSPFVRRLEEKSDIRLEYYRILLILQFRRTASRCRHMSNHINI